MGEPKRAADFLKLIVRQARIGGSEPIPLLEELLTAWPEVRVNIDAKHDGAVAPLLALLKRMDVLDRVCIGSFSDSRLAQVRAVFGSEACTSMGPKEAARFWLARRRLPVGRFAANCAQLPVKQGIATLVDSAAVAAANRLGLQLHLMPEFVEVDVFPVPVQLIFLHQLGVRSDRRHFSLVEQHDLVRATQSRKP